MVVIVVMVWRVVRQDWVSVWSVCLVLSVEWMDSTGSSVVVGVLKELVANVQRTVAPSFCAGLRLPGWQILRLRDFQDRACPATVQVVGQ